MVRYYPRDDAKLEPSWKLRASYFGNNLGNRPIAETVEDLRGLSMSSKAGRKSHRPRNTNGKGSASEAAKGVHLHPIFEGSCASSEAGSDAEIVAVSSFWVTICDNDSEKSKPKSDRQEHFRALSGVYDAAPNQKRRNVFRLRNQKLPHA